MSFCNVLRMGLAAEADAKFGDAWTLMQEISRVQRLNHFI